MELKKEHINKIRELEKEAVNKMTSAQLLHIILDYLEEQIEYEESLGGDL